MLNAQDCSNLINLLNRVQITGQEAMTVAMLQSKLQSIFNEEMKQPAEQVTGVPVDKLSIEEKPEEAKATE